MDVSRKQEGWLENLTVEIVIKDSILKFKHNWFKELPVHLKEQ
jgi:hypothetical protein